MDLLAFLRLAARRWWVIALAGLAGAVVAGMFPIFNHPRYQSTVSLQLNPAATSAFLPYGADSANTPVQDLAASYAEVLRSRTFATAVVQTLNLPLLPTAVASAIDARLVPDTNILLLTVTWSNPADAQNLAEQVAKIFIDQNLQQQEGDSGTTQISDLESSANNIQTRITSLQQQRDKLAQAVGNGDLSNIGDLNSLDETLSSLQSSQANLLVEINREKSSVNTAAILDDATPGAAVGVVPLPQALLLGVLAGLAIATSIVVATGRLDKVVHDPEDVVDSTGSPPIVAVGRLPRRKLRRGERTWPVAQAEPNSIIAESFRTLRANLGLSSVEHPLKVVVVTSPAPREGKTVTATNLATTFAQAGKRVLLLDADIRRPAIHSYFGLANVEGFCELIQQWPSVMEAKTGGFGNGWVRESGVQNLWVITAGQAHPSPGEIVSSDVTAEVIQTAARYWDVVIVDTPPVGPFADALLLARSADGIVLVARAGQTRAAGLRSTVETLGLVGRPILGVVLNDLRPSLLSRYSEYSYYYYGNRGYYGYSTRVPVESASDRSAG